MLVSIYPMLNDFLTYCPSVAHYIKDRPPIAAMKVTSVVDPKLLVPLIYTCLLLLMYAYMCIGTTECIIKLFR